ncbi:MAG: AAA family ATPase [Pirellulales bacterium]
MKISDIHIDGFGVWNDLQLGKLSPEVTVFYGPNEAGKTTLMQFVRSVLYGVSPERRERYLPPLAGGRPGGKLGLHTDDGPIEVTRYADRGDSDLGRATVLLPSGETQGDRLVRESLAHVDEPTYNNVFAVGLDEIQQLGTLSGTDAAQWIYRLTSGIDRVSLYDVIIDLRKALAKTLSSGDTPSEITTLLARRDQLTTELDELVLSGRRWSQLAVELREVDEQVETLQTDLKKVDRRVRRVETAIQVKPNWLKRLELDTELCRYDGLYPLEPTAIADLDEQNKQIREHQRERDVVRGQRQQLREESQRLGINEVLVRNTARIDALAEQQDWLESLQHQSAEMDAEAKQLQSRVASELDRLGGQWTGKPKETPQLTKEMVEQLRPQAEELHLADVEAQAALRELEKLRGHELQYRSQMESALTSGEKLGLPTTIEGAGELVARLRRRLQAEQKLEQARRHAIELEQDGHELLDEQVTPLWMFGLLMSMSVVGFAMLAVYFMSSDPEMRTLGGWLAALGIGGTIFAWMFKYGFEESSADRLDACHHQMDVVERQIKEAESQKEQIDREIPMTEGSVVLRLQHAERHLAELEQMLPVETQRRQADTQCQAADRRHQQTRERLATATRNWQGKIKALGLPAEVMPDDLQVLAGQYEQLAEMQARAAHRRDEIERRQRELAKVAGRIRALNDEAGIKVDSPEPLVQLQKLLEERRRQEMNLAHRQKLRERSAALREEAKRHARAVLGLERRREALFHKASVATEEAFRQLAAELTAAAKLRERREALSREIAAAAGKLAGDEEFLALLAPEVIGRLDGRYDSLTTEHSALDKSLKEQLARRGSLTEQQKLLVDDRHLADKQMELDCMETQLSQSKQKWRVLATLSLILELIRHDYEEHRQPETLKEATEFLKAFTRGQYVRIWTPLANDILLVDTADGKSLPVDVLSRGTREQLFLSIRLALVAMYARRGIQLPMVLDDVLVNFDAGRSAIAARVLRDFAKQGHQLLVFTCHEHVWQMFRELQIDSRRLPSRFGEIEPEPFVAEPVAEELEEPVEEIVETFEPTTEPEPEYEPLEYEPLDYEYGDLPPPPVEEPVIEFEYRHDREPPRVPESEPREVEYYWPDEPLKSDWYEEDRAMLPLEEPVVFTHI